MSTGDRDTGATPPPSRLSSGWQVAASHFHFPVLRQQQRVSRRNCPHGL